MLHKVLLTSVFVLPNSALAQIPLDRIAPQTPHVLVKEGDGETLFGWIGRKAPWRARKATAEEARSFVQLTPGNVETYSNLAQITETAIPGSETRPGQREYNLPDLIDRLVLSRALPKGIERYAAQSKTILVVNVPTLISASFAVDRPVEIVNTGTRLVVVCPFCSNVTLRNEKASDAITDPDTEYWSYVCPQNFNISSGLKVFPLWRSWINTPCRVESRLDPGKTLTLSNRLAQGLLTQVIRAETPFETLQRWKNMFNVTFGEIR